ncbi:hypothetical protein BO70DRAFT_351653 [Aspergillus heteromorphus CBS 117.55]|uniref:Uncharacterized protein n=1 Tax=Aspergillus heteromorphus CBS 117.55 TaxID=1448321 RepID=A0A317WHZ6_9EURO|nr:uncharacterized protein BO70DRAFT_351653 [Aspergillus heteromorphus CBS 117.55]PWY86013.1 hypothetical protein BO70DRAFT_351653 [Aspergillus heteromorphus CBS 117.55]
MTAIIQKLRRKRKLSSELHSRWGDVAISYPTGGSWSQWEQSSRAGPSAIADHGQRRGSLEPNRSATSTRMGSHSSLDARAPSVDSAMTIPTGHYDARVGNRSRRMPQSCSPPTEPLPIESPRAWSPSGSDDDSGDEEDETEVPAPLNLSRGRHHAHPDEADIYSRASKSPPLSVTSRMRRFSVQSHMGESSTSGPGTTSSRHTSYTSSTPSNPSDDSRHHNYRPATQPERKPVRRPKPEPLTLRRQPELVPSYDELYG